ncbi:MAG: hypothetical protein QOK32_952, partial [Gaiellaceae bacterium]|nr:hypothetical protein [Gaiellaceae bacterium]
FGFGFGFVTTVVVVWTVVVVVVPVVVVPVVVVVDPVVVVPVVVVVDPVVVVPVVVVVDVLCRIAAGLLPATTAAAKPPRASVRHTAAAVPSLRIWGNPLCSSTTFAAACFGRLTVLLTASQSLNAVSFGERKGTSRASCILQKGA